MSEELQKRLDAVNEQLEKEDLSDIIVDFDEGWYPTASDCLSSLYDLTKDPNGLIEATKRYHEGRKKDYEERKRLERRT